jgi:hypothetical protein
VLGAAGRAAPLLCPSAPGSTHSLSGGKVEKFETALQSAVLWIYVFELPGSEFFSQKYTDPDLYVIEQKW